MTVLVTLLLVALSQAFSVTHTSAAIGGLATWYEDPRSPAGIYAAAGPDLRAWLGRDWRGSVVTVSADGGAVTTALTDWCACGSRHDRPTLLDLSADAFSRLAPLSAGVVAVSVTQARIDVPATDTAP